MNQRRSGRTTAGLRAALQLTRTNANVFFVVWHQRMVEYTMRDVYEADYLRGIGRPERLRVVSYEVYQRGYSSDCQSPVIYDHYVLEELEYQRTGQRQRDTIKCYLKIGEWYQEKVIGTEYLSRGYFTPVYKMAVIEPIAAWAYHASPCDCDTSVQMKTVTFRHKGNYKDGVPVLEEV